MDFLSESLNLNTLHSYYDTPTMNDPWARISDAYEQPSYDNIPSSPSYLEIEDHSLPNLKNVPGNQTSFSTWFNKEREKRKEKEKRKKERKEERKKEGKREEKKKEKEKRKKKKKKGGQGKRTPETLLLLLLLLLFY